MDSAVAPRDHLRASLLLVLGEVPAHGYDLPGLLAPPLGLGTADRAVVYRTLRPWSPRGGGLELGPVAVRPGPPHLLGDRRRPGMESGAAASLREADRHIARWLARYRRLVRHGGPQFVRVRRQLRRLPRGRKRSGLSGRSSGPAEALAKGMNSASFSVVIWHER